MSETEKSAISRSESHQHQWGYARNVLEFVRNAEFAPLCIERNLGVNGAARSELTQLSLVKFVIGGARVELKRKPIQKVPLYGASSKLALKFGIPVAAMDTPPVAKTDLRPWRSQIEALLVGIAMSPVVRRAVLDAFEEQGLLAYTEPEPEITVDELGRLRKTRVNQALEDFDENLRSRVISVLEQLHAIA
jgi:hypothetical protein